MKKLFALGTLLFASSFASSSFAQSWEHYARTDNENRYFDPVRMVVMSGIAFIWDLHDLHGEGKEADKVYRSVLYPTEYNCRFERKRVLSVMKMADKMGRGESVAEDTLVGRWTDVQPGTPDSRLMKAACDAQ